LSLAAVAALHWVFYDGGATVYGMQRMMVGDPMAICWPSSPRWR